VISQAAGPEEGRWIYFKGQTAPGYSIVRK